MKCWLDTTNCFSEVNCIFSILLSIYEFVPDAVIELNLTDFIIIFTGTKLNFADFIVRTLVFALLIEDRMAF